MEAVLIVLCRLGFKIPISKAGHGYGLRLRSVELIEQAVTCGRAKRVKSVI